MSETRTEAKLVEVTLAKPHTHDGVEYAAKAKLKVTETDRAWLTDNGVVDAPKEGAK